MKKLTLFIAVLAFTACQPPKVSKLQSDRMKVEVIAEQGNTSVSILTIDSAKYILVERNRSIAIAPDNRNLNP